MEINSAEYADACAFYYSLGLELETLNETKTDRKQVGDNEAPEAYEEEECADDEVLFNGATDDPSVMSIIALAGQEQGMSTRKQSRELEIEQPDIDLLEHFPAFQDHKMMEKRNEIARQIHRRLYKRRRYPFSYPGLVPVIPSNTPAFGLGSMTNLSTLGKRDYELYRNITMNLHRPSFARYCYAEYAYNETKHSASTNRERRMISGEDSVEMFPVIDLEELYNDFVANNCQETQDDVQTNGKKEKDDDEKEKEEEEELHTKNNKNRKKENTVILPQQVAYPLLTVAKTGHTTMINKSSNLLIPMADTNNWFIDASQNKEDSLFTPVKLTREMIVKVASSKCQVNDSVVDALCCALKMFVISTGRVSPEGTEKCFDQTIKDGLPVEDALHLLSLVNDVSRLSYQNEEDVIDDREDDRESQIYRTPRFSTP